MALEKKKILVVNRIEKEKKIIQKNLANKYTIIFADSIPDSVEEFRNNLDSIEFILLDIDESVSNLHFLPSMLKNPLYKLIPVIILTEDKDKYDFYQKLGMNILIFKPLDKEKLSLACIKGEETHALAKKEKNQPLDEYDQITGLLRPVSFFKKVSKVLTKDNIEDYLLIKGDISHFKYYNEFYGTHMGDIALMELGTIISSDSKCIFTSRSDRSDVYFVLFKGTFEEFKESYQIVSYQLNAFNKNVKLYLQVGVYQLKKGIELEKAYTRVSIAHKKAKKLSGSNVVLFDQKLEDELSIKKKINSDFASALSNHEFKAYIQPKYNIFTNSYCGGEVLCRWIDKSGKITSPGVFIPILEDNGMIVKLDEYMLYETCKIIRSWLDNNIKPVPLSVNLSRVNFFEEGLGKKLLGVINELKIPHNLIQIEITESVYVELEKEVSDFVNMMRGNEIDVLMDDFGSGYSSLNMLKDINVSTLKIDYRFLTKDEIKGRRKNILEAVIKLARSIDIPIIIEGVEEAEDATYLKSMGVRYIQGYLFGKPMPLEEFNKLDKSMNNKDLSNYHSLVLDDLIDTRSSTNTVFDYSLSSMAICEYFKGNLKFISVNRAMRVSAVADKVSGNFFGINFMDFVCKQDRQRAEDYLQEVCAKGEVDPLEINYQTTGGIIKIRLRISLLAQKDQIYTLLLDVMKLYDVNENQLNQVDFLYATLDDLDVGYYILNKNHKVLFINKKAKEILPHFKPGVSCEDFKRYDENCNLCPLLNEKSIMSYFSENLDKYIENYVTPLKINGEQVKLVRISTLNKSLIDSDSGVLRMNKALTNENDVYTEVNLDTMEYKQVTFAKTKVFNIPSVGDYKEWFKIVTDNQIDKRDVQLINDNFSPEGMLTNFNNGKKVVVKFKFKDQKEWGKISCTYIEDNNVRYACYYTSNITEEILKDFDSLTGLLTSSAAKHYINNFLLRNANNQYYFVLIDFDNFRDINESCGFNAGDKLLANVTKELKIGGQDILLAARLGADEFGCIALGNENFSEDEINAEINSNLEKVAKENKIHIHISASIGISKYPYDGGTFDKLYEVADKKMFINKKLNKHRKKD